jgi:hypothetical protein
VRQNQDEGLGVAEEELPALRDDLLVAVFFKIPAAGRDDDDALLLVENFPILVEEAVVVEAIVDASSDKDGASNDEPFAFVTFESNNPLDDELLLVLGVPWTSDESLLTRRIDDLPRIQAKPRRRFFASSSV